MTRWQRFKLIWRFRKLFAQFVWTGRTFTLYTTEISGQTYLHATQQNVADSRVYDVWVNQRED